MTPRQARVPGTGASLRTLLGKGAEGLFSLSALGVLVWFLSSTSFSSLQLTTFLILLAFGVMTEWFGIPLRNGWTTVSDGVYYAALLLLGPARAGILIFTSMLGGYLAGTPRKNGRMAILPILSNIGLILFPMLLAGKLYTAFGSPDLLHHSFLSFLIFASMVIVFNLSNQLFAMLYLYLNKGLCPLEGFILDHWDEQLLHFSFLMPILGLLLATFMQHAPLASLLLLPMIVIAREAIAHQTSILGNAQKTIEVLASTLDQRDENTYNHSIRVSILAGALARHLGLLEYEVEKIEWAAKIHDLGKISISDCILLKPGPLTHEEFHHIQGHANTGAEVADRLGFCKEEAIMVRSHHEKFDGTGYPHGLKGEEILLGARILSVADCFDALTTTRVYHSALTLEEVLSILDANKGTHFDPKIVDAFANMLQVNLYCEVSKNLEPNSINLAPLLTSFPSYVFSKLASIRPGFTLF